jgi:mRNA interferase MazF
LVTEPAAPSPGDLVWLEFDPTLGTEQSGRRPAMVISDRGYNAATGRALVMPLTSRARGYPFEVALPSTASPTGVILVDQIKCVDLKARFARAAGAAPPGVLAEARAKLAALTGTG